MLNKTIFILQINTNLIVIHDPVPRINYINVSVNVNVIRIVWKFQSCTQK